MAAIANALDNAELESNSVLRFVARQPILDLQGKVHGYELLFRAGPEASFRGDGNFATRTMLDNTVIFGLDKLTVGLPAFVNCTLESLTERFVDVSPPSLTVLEILETLEPIPELVALCLKLKSLGYRIALDDFSWHPKFTPMVKLADYIKVDFIQTDAAERQELLYRLRGTPAILVAEKVETLEVYKQACKEGFTLFQGYYFCRPQLMQCRKIPANQISHIHMLKLLQQDPLDLHQLSQLVKRDTSLAYRYLRLVNSPMFAMRQKISSIMSALLLVGDDAVRRIATLAITSELSAQQPPELLRMAFVRGRFCELASSVCGLGRGEQYLLGMFSLLPAMLRIPMINLAPELPLREEIRAALMGTVSRESSLLRWAEFHERGDWEECDAIIHAYGLNLEKMTWFYAEAVVWADSALNYSK
jgi:EAL and modified HD-GYP domain-containing signal transduction protein